MTSKIDSSSRSYISKENSRPAKKNLNQESLKALYLKSREDWKAWEAEQSKLKRSSSEIKLKENPAPSKKPRLYRTTSCRSFSLL